jgi:hypothetical protein
MLTAEQVMSIDRAATSESETGDEKMATQIDHFPLLSSKKLKIALGTLVSILTIAFGGPGLGLPGEIIEQIILAITGIGSLFIGAHAYTDAKVSQVKVKAATSAMTPANLGVIAEIVTKLAPMLEKFFMPPDVTSGPARARVIPPWAAEHGPSPVGTEAEPVKAEPVKTEPVNKA